MLRIHTVGAGGGSIARFDRGGALQVGPESAGADPGPICYGRGDQPTVTDADLVLGRIEHRGFLGGSMYLDLDRTRAMFERAKGPFATVENFANGIVQLAEARMEQALREISIEQGHDPREFTLVAFGGAGPLHACALAHALGISKVLIPNNPGALSAYGILVSDLVREYSRTVMLAPGDPNVEHHIAELEKRGEGTPIRSLDLRYKGQGYELNVAWQPDFVDAFHRLHEKRYGYSDRNRPVEVVNVRVRMVQATEAIARQPAARERAGLHPGDRITGPAVIPEYSATTYIPSGFTAMLDDHLNLIVEVPDPNRSDERSDWVTEARSDWTSPVQLAILKSALQSVAHEMGAALRRTAFSPNIKERRDYSSAVFDCNGNVIAMGDDMPVHLGSMPMSVRAALDALTVEPGDIAILNDAYAGGTHLPDITMIMPVKSAFYVANRAHHADVGGMYPGSMGLCSEIWQEGIRIPPVKLVRNGVINDDVLRLILKNVRTPHEREGDLTAQIGACRVGAARIDELIAKHGVEALQRNVSTLLDHSERLIRDLLRSFPEGEFEAEDFIDDDGIAPDPVPIRVRIKTHPPTGELDIDFSASAPQVRGSLNAVRAVTWSAIFYVLRCLLPEEAAANAGLMRPVHVITQPGTVVDAQSPAAVAGGNVETSQRIVDVLMRALSQILPDRIPAASSGSMSNLTIGGIDPRTHEPFAYYETIAGGSGARPNCDGVPGVHTHMTNSLNTPIEALEYAYPFRVRRYSYRTCSGGKGRYKGGDGLIRELEVLGTAQVTILSDRRRFAPYGLQGGSDGARGRNVLIRDGEEIELPGKCNSELGAGTIVRIETPGGGGYGIQSEP